MPSVASRVFLEFDVGGARAAYARAAAFVDATNLRYGFTSKDIEKLGGSEKARIEEYYASDFEWGAAGEPILINKPPDHRVVFELNTKESPLACENFVALCTNVNKKSAESGCDLSYRNVKMHRVLKGFMAQGGDIQFGNGSGGESIWGKKFKDDKGGLKLKHDKRGVLSMGNSGKNSNTSQFFITFAPLKELDGKHVVFGRVVEGMEVLDVIEAECREDSTDETPKNEIVIVDCGTC